MTTDTAQATLPFDDAAPLMDYARHFAAHGNVDMANIYLHRYATAAGERGITALVDQLRTLAHGRCLHPEAIGDPALFNRPDPGSCESTRIAS